MSQSGLLCLALLWALVLGPVVHAADCNNNGIDDVFDLRNIVDVTAANVCAEAGEIGPDIVYSGTTVGSTLDGTATCGSAANSPDDWYAYSPAATGSVTVSLCGSGYDTVLSVVNGCGGTQVVCNDDFCDLISQVTFAATAGSRYLIRVSGYNGSTGAFTLNLNGPASVYGSSNDFNNDSIPDECQSLVTPERNRLSATYVFLGATPTETLRVDAETTATLNLRATSNVDWLTVTPSSQVMQTSTTLNLAYDPSAFDTAQVLTGQLELVADTGSTSTTLALPVRFELLEPTPDLSLQPSQLQLQARSGSPPFTREVVARNLAIRSTAVSYGTVVSWASIQSPGSTLTDAPTTATVRIDPSTLAPGSYTGFVSVISSTISSEFALTNLTLQVLPPDCNGNGIDDPVDIASGEATDCNANGIPDSCELTTETDANANGRLDSCEPGQYANLPFFEPFDPGALRPMWRVDGEAPSVSIEQVDDAAGTASVLQLDDLNGLANEMFRATFESDQSTSFTVSNASANGTPDFLANFNYDFVAYNGPSSGLTTTPARIAASPRSATGERRALRLEVNQRDATGSAAVVTAVPNIPNTTSLRQFRLSFDAFMNFCGQGSATGGTATGTGTTEFLGAGITADPSVPLGGFGTFTNGWLWAMSGEGGSTTDYDYYEGSGDALTRGRDIPNWFEAGLGAVNGGAAQWLGLFTNPAHEQGGSPGKTWVTVDMVYSEGRVELYFTPSVGTQAGVRTLVASWQSGSLLGAEVAGLPAVTYFDAFNSVAGTPADQFALIDNLEVYDGAGDSRASQNHATLGLNLEGETGVRLTYRARVHLASDEEPLVGPQRDEVAANAVLVSADGGRTWYEIASLRQPTGGFSLYDVDLDSAIAELGLEYTDSFQIRFSQTGLQQAPEGGYEIDLVKVTNAATSQPALASSVQAFNFDIIEGTAVAASSVSITNVGGGQASFTVSADAEWILPEVTEGTSFGEAVIVPVAFATTQLPIGVHVGRLTASDRDTTASVQIPVTVRVTRPTEVNLTRDPADVAWTLVTPELPEFTGVVTGRSIDRRYRIDAAGKVAVGFLESQPVDVNETATAPAVPGHRPILGDPTTLYEVEWDVDLLPPGPTAPAVRFRTGSTDFSRTDMLVVSPEFKPGSSLIGGGSLSIPKVFRQVIASRGGVEALRSSLDIVNASDRDATATTVFLNSAKFRTALQQGFEVPGTAFVPIASINLRNSNVSEFQSGSVPSAFAAPEIQDFGVEGLRLIGQEPRKTTADLGATIVGWWESPVIPFASVPEGQLVRVSWTITTTATEETRSAVPPFRLRTSSDEIVYTYLTMIDSMEDGAGVPIAGESRTYDQYFIIEENVTSGEGTANAQSLWSFAIDYIYTPDRGDDPTIGVIIQQIDVVRFL